MAYRNARSETEEARAKFYRKLTELMALLNKLGPQGTKRAMDLVMELKNNPDFMLFTITYESVPDDISSLLDEGEEE